MKITFYSNFMNHHQLPFCEQMYKQLGDDFKFIATEPVPKERLELGYQDMNKLYPFIITTYDDIKNEKKAMSLSIDSDVIITGSAPEIYTANRMKYNKITFRYSERIFKTGKWRILDPRVICNLLKNHTRYRNKKLYMLCASAYTSSDFSLVKAYRGKTYKWGYFPEFINYDIDNLILNKKADKIRLLWCGRFLEWKHPEKAIYIAKKLRDSGYKFEMNIIGTGIMKNTIEKLVYEEDLNKFVNILGPMNPENVRKYMETSNIFLFTSDYNEGWGAVLNEAMNSGCAVVASNAIGSVPFLIEHGKNGMIYRNNKNADLWKNVKYLMDNAELIDKLGKEAYRTLKHTWNSKVAVKRFLKISEALLEENSLEFEDGPCSHAKNIYQ